MITTDLIKELREKTGCGMMECKTALGEANGDMEKAIEVLRKKGIAKAVKKADRQTREGFIGSYIHSNGKIGVLVEVACETDFVGKNEDFRAFAKEVAMHIAAANPSYVKREDVPSELVEKEKNIQRELLKDKPAQVADKILEGKMKKYFSDICLLEQPYVRNDKLSITDFLNQKINQFGENLVIRRFVRMTMG
ncbi:MAG: translation elongation factor Ts [Candidatus Aureabacteria bacterium]|nr:translation elongation factor Ts [Candidatus Auribacterota bacterium]